MVAERGNFQSVGNTLNLQVLASFVYRRNLANGEMLDNKYGSHERKLLVILQRWFQ